MAKIKSNLLELDIDQIFEERNIDEIIEIRKLLDAEIEKKHNALRTMVGDRYKDVLVASDAIKSMNLISQEIVDHIDKIMNTCETFVISPTKMVASKSNIINKQKYDERAVIAQIRLAMFLNEQIWIAIDGDNNLDATQYYLLGQHIHTGLSLYKEEFITKIPLLQQIKSNLITLRAQISQKIREKLETVEITAEELSQNLNALMLLDNQSLNDLLGIYIEHRKTALTTVINAQYSSVRAKICSMVKCLITTVHLLHNCFISLQDGTKALICKHLQEVISETSLPTISKLKLPVSPLFSYIPDIVKQFRPKCNMSNNENVILKDAEKLIEIWLQQTQKIVNDGLGKSLPLITSIKGLHYTREESLRIGLPENWESICNESHLPKKFTIWSYFFQNAITSRCEELISLKVNEKLVACQNFIRSILNKVGKNEKSEADLRWYLWEADSSDLNKWEINQKALSMKTKGFTRQIVDLCETVDKNYLDLLQDVSFYIYGEEYNSKEVFKVLLHTSSQFENKLSDKAEIENHLRMECIKNASQIAEFVKQNLEGNSGDSLIIIKSIICARVLDAMTQLCPHFEKCCTLNNSLDNWLKICDSFNKSINSLWITWVDKIVEQTKMECQELDDLTHYKMIKLLARWDEIEIQEQTDDKVFTSIIRVPLKPNVALNKILESLYHKLTCVLPHTLPKMVHLHFIEQNISVIIDQYKILADTKLNQKQALQFLFDVKYLTTFFIARENVQMMNSSHDICDKFRSQIDPFDLDVFYSYLQNNVKKAVSQSQTILGCLLPSSVHLANLGNSEKSKERDQNPSIIAMTSATPSFWFPLLPITVPSQKTSGQAMLKRSNKDEPQKQDVKAATKRTDPASSMKQSAASLFGGLTTDWFSY